MVSEEIVVAVIIFVGLAFWLGVLVGGNIGRGRHES